MTLPEHPDPDPNEAYEVIPMVRSHPRDPEGWWSVTCNGLPFRHSADKAAMERYASDPDWRRRVEAGEVKLWER
jgi:hypothetical protein